MLENKREEREVHGRINAPSHFNAPSHQDLYDRMSNQFGANEGGRKRLKNGANITDSGRTDSSGSAFSSRSATPIGSAPVSY